MITNERHNTAYIFSQENYGLISSIL